MDVVSPSMTGRVVEWATKRPDAVAVVYGQRQLSYAQLLDDARALAVRVDAAAADKATVGLHAPSGLEFVVAFVALGLTRRRLVIFDVTWPDAQLERVLATVGLDVVLVAGQPSAVFDAHAIPVVPMAQVHQVQRGRRRRCHLAELSGGSGLPSTHSQSFVVFTSGTTSTPKAVVRTRASWDRSLATSARLFAAHPGDTTLAPGPLTSGITLYALAESLCSGGTFIGESHAVDVAGALACHRPTRLVCVPAMVERLLSSNADLSMIDTLVTSGSKMDDATLRAFFSAAPHAIHVEYYGASELSFVSYSTTRQQDLPRPAGDVGLPFPGVDVQIRDDGAHELAAGQIGTIWVRSELTSDGYLAPPAQASQDTTVFNPLPSALAGAMGVGPAKACGFRRDGQWSSVGDQGFLAGGRLHVLGREADMVIINGNNVYPSEIETVLANHPRIGRACVVTLDAKLAAVVELIDELAPSLASVRGFLLSQVPKYKLPASIWVTDAVPRTSTGKVNRQAVAALVAGGQLRRLV